MNCSNWRSVLSYLNLSLKMMNCYWNLNCLNWKNLTSLSLKMKSLNLMNSMNLKNSMNSKTKNSKRSLMMSLKNCYSMTMKMMNSNCLNCSKNWMTSSKSLQQVLSHPNEEDVSQRLSLCGESLIVEPQH